MKVYVLTEEQIEMTGMGKVVGYGIKEENWRRTTVEPVPIGVYDNLDLAERAYAAQGGEDIDDYTEYEPTNRIWFVEQYGIDELEVEDLGDLKQYVNKTPEELLKHKVYTLDTSDLYDQSEDGGVLIEDKLCVGSYLERYKKPEEEE